MALEDSVESIIVIMNNMNNMHALVLQIFPSFVFVTGSNILFCLPLFCMWNLSA